MKIIFNENLNQGQLEEMFANDDKCLDYLSKIKWPENFECRKCGNDNSCDGKVPYSRRCTRCKNEESATANTLFHNIKFPVNKAFYIVYNVCHNQKSLSTYDMAIQLGIRQITCWNFKHKVENKLIRLNNASTNETVSMLDVLVGNAESPFL
jgi:hypothetical protein